MLVVFILSLFTSTGCSKLYIKVAEKAFNELTAMTLCGAGGVRRLSQRRDGTDCRKTSTRVYVDDGFNRSLRAYLPDGPLTAGARNRVNGFLVLDPFPDDEYGHFVAIFAFWMCDTDNNLENNIRLETGVCLRFLYKCGNRTTDFLPKIFVDRHSTTFMENPCRSTIEAVDRSMKRHRHTFKCRNLPGFQVCPPIVEQSIQSSIRNVDENPALVEQELKLMRMYKGERFVHRTAIIVRGSSWLPHVVSKQRRTSTQNEFFRLRDNLIQRGVDPRWILSFYGNGMFHDVAQNFTNVYAAKKIYISTAIEKVCSVKTAVIRNLIIYFVGSATDTASFLLHDRNDDVIAQENERISPSDLKCMLENCAVQKIHVVTDFPNSVELLKQYFSTQVELHLPDGAVPLERSTSRENGFLDTIL